MKHAALTLTAALTALTALAAPAVACPPAHGPAPCLSQITYPSVTLALPRLLQEQGIVFQGPAMPVMHSADLDGNPQTEEALVTVVSSAMCGPKFECPTVVVVARGSQMYTVGHGTKLVTLRSSTNGWLDLGEQELSIFGWQYNVIRAVRWDGLRYVH